MNLSFRAGFRSGRSLVVPAIIAAVGTTVASLVTFRLGLTDIDAKDYAKSVLIQVVAGLLTYALLFVVTFWVAAVIAIRRDRVSRAAEEQDSMIALANDRKIVGILQKLLGDTSLGVSQCYLFGSIIHRYPTRDVDAAIVFSSSKERRVRKYRKRLYGAQRQFASLYEGLPLNLTLFLSSEEDELRTFLQCAGQYERII